MPQASDAQLAGERISIAASVATDYFQLRQADVNIRMLKEQQDLYGRILAMTQTGFKEGFASGDDVLNAQENLQIVIADLQTTEISREQNEHAIAVLTGTPPESFAIAARSRTTSSFRPMCRRRCRRNCWNGATTW